MIKSALAVQKDVREKLKSFFQAQNDFDRAALNLETIKAEAIKLSKFQIGDKIEGRSFSDGKLETFEIREIDVTLSKHTKTVHFLYLGPKILNNGKVSKNVRCFAVSSVRLKRREEESEELKIPKVDAYIAYLRLRDAQERMEVAIKELTDAREMAMSVSPYKVGMRVQGNEVERRFRSAVFEIDTIDANAHPQANAIRFVYSGYRVNRQTKQLSARRARCFAQALVTVSRNY